MCLSGTVTFIHTCVCWITPEYSCRVAHYMVHYQYYPWQATPCAVLWGIPSGRIYGRVPLSCSRTLFHLMAVLWCLDVQLYTVMIFLIWDVWELSAHSALRILWNKLSRRHRGPGRNFLQGIRKPSAVLEHASEADTKLFFLILKVQPGAAFSACCWGSPLRAVRREDGAHQCKGARCVPAPGEESC